MTFIKKSEQCDYYDCMRCQLHWQFMIPDLGPAHIKVSGTIDDSVKLKYD